MLRVKYEDSDFDNIRRQAIKLLGEQEYTVDYIRAYIASHISTDKYHGIELAYDSEYGDKSTRQEVLAFADDFIVNYVYSKIVELGPDYEFDYTSVIDDLLSENEYDIANFDNDFEYLKDREAEDYQREMDELNSYYYDSRGV